MVSQKVVINLKKTFLFLKTRLWSMKKKMNTIQINKLMENDKYTKKIYLGTFPIDKLPEKLKYPSCRGPPLIQ